MPTASEAAGRMTASRYGCGASPGPRTWTTNGRRRETPAANRVSDSYLERFQQLKKAKRNKADLLQGEQDNTEPTNCEDDGTKEESTEENASRGSQASGKPTSDERPLKKSRLCVVL